MSGPDLWSDAARGVASAWQTVARAVRDGEAVPGDGDVMISVGLPDGLQADIYISKSCSMRPLRLGVVEPIRILKR